MKPFIFLTLTLAFTMHATTQADEPWQSLYRSDKIADNQGGELPYRFMVPEGFAEKGKEKFPLLIFLHGAGERGADNGAQLKHCAVEFAKAERRRKHPAFVVFPQCPNEQKWADVDWSQREIDFKEDPSQSMRLTLKLLDQMCEKYPIDKSRIYIAGLSMGGYGTWHALGLRPDVWAAAIPVCGGADLGWAEKMVGTPIWVFHGDQDKAVPVQNSRDIVAKLKELKAQVKYTEYPGVGHDSWTQTFSNDEVLDWLFSQVKK